MAGFGRILNLVTATTNYRAIMSLRNLSICGPANAVFKNRVMESLGLPPPPKKPMSPFFKYLQMVRPKVVEENPQMKVPDVLKLIAKQWVAYDVKDKLVLQKEFDTEMLAYSKKKMQYDQSITPEQRNLIKEAARKRKDMKERLAMRRKVAQLGKPRKPATSFIQFMQEQKYAKDSEEKGLEWVKNRAEQWKLMSAEEKEKYQIESKKLMARYKEDMKEWEEKMVRMGHLDVVRNRGLIDLKSSKPE